MLHQLASQLQAAENRPIYRDNLVPFVVLFTFLLTFWLVYSGVARDVAQYIDLNAPAFAATADQTEATTMLSPSITINPYTFDQLIDPDWNYTQGYGYPQ